MTRWLVFILVNYVALGLTASQETCSYWDVMNNLNITEANPRLTSVRPVTDWKEPSIIRIDVTLHAILDLDEKLQILTSLVRFRMSWKNQFLTWDPQSFCGISSISIPVDSVWQPDLSVAEMTEDPQSPTVPFLSLSSDGTINLRKPIRIMSTCNLDIYKFPFDTQKCNLTFGTYMHTVQDIIVVPKSNSSAVTQSSREIYAKSEWLLGKVDVLSNNISTEEKEWSQVIYQITIQRVPLLYVINLIVPAGFLVIVDVASMFIPMEGGERLGFKITVVLGFSVLLLILNDLLSNSEVTPILGVFCAVCLVIMIISIIDSIFISYMLHLSAVRPDVPQWLKIWVLKHLAFILRIDTAGATESNAVGVRNTDKATSVVRKEADMPNRMCFQKEHDSVEVKLLKKVLLELLMIRRHMIMSKREDEAKSEWHMVAFVLDRFILICYLLTVFIILITVVVVWAF
ncbi:5-hydroxytryptamine receptor 3A-like [Emydura macquarii macquarii]|uniref:5-hydroxytryptamine receptor 3A-like n=1 Tax=Emydura macquarii macquarii TaxID=1129001 RepID=UPI00352A2EED